MALPVKREPIDLSAGHDDEDDDDAAASAHICHDCHKAAPPTNTAHTLISSLHGWRLTRRAVGDGTFAFEWRCRPCSTLHRQRIAPST